MLSGNLRDLSFPLLLQALIAKTGVLELWHLEDGQRYTLYIKRGEIRCVKGEQGFLDAEEAREVLRKLSISEQGAFEFITKRYYRTPCEPSFKWPVERVVRSLNTWLIRQQLRKTRENPV